MSDDTIIDQLSKELSVTGDFARVTKLPQIIAPTATVESLQAAVRAIKVVIDAREGNSSILDKSLTLRDLIRSGAVELSVGGLVLGGTDGGFSFPGPGAGSSAPVGYIDPRPVLATPPTLTSFVATGTFGSVFLDWAMSEYKNHSHVEVWRATTNSLGVSVQIGSSTSSSYVDASGSASTVYYYWARAIGVSPAGSPIVGAFNAVSGTPGGRLLIGNVDLGPLVVQAANLAAGSVTQAKVFDGAITVNKLFVGGGGAALNSDPTMTDLTALSGAGYSVVSVADGKVGTKAMQLTDSSIVQQSPRFPITAGKTYRVSVWARNISGSAFAWLRLRQYNGGGAEVSYNAGFEGVSIAGGGWILLTGKVVAAAGVVEAIVDLNSNFLGVGVNQFQDLRCVEAIDADVIVDGAVRANHLAANSLAVGTAAIQNAAITNAMIANLAVDTAKIADLSVSTAKIADAAITTLKVGDATITNAKIVNLDAAKITTGFLGAGRIAAGSIDATKIDTRGLTIKDGAGTVILSSGVPLDWTRVTGAGKAADNATVGASFGVNIGGQITPLNASTYIQSAAITNALIGGVISSNGYSAGTAGWAIDKGGSVEFNNGTFRGALGAASGTFSGVLTASAISAVDTINLAGNAVTVPIAGSVSGTGRSSTSTTSRTTSVTIGSIATSPVGAGRVLLQLSPNGISTISAWWIYSYLFAECSMTDNPPATFTMTFQIKRNGTVIWTQSTTGAVGGSGTSTRFCHAPLLIDTPGAGVTATYTFEISTSTTGAATNHAHEVVPFTYILTENKR